MTVWTLDDSLAMHAWICAWLGPIPGCPPDAARACAPWPTAGQTWATYRAVGARPALSTSEVEYTQPFGTATLGGPSMTLPPFAPEKPTEGPEPADSGSTLRTGEVRFGRTR